MVTLRDLLDERSDLDRHDWFRDFRELQERSQNTVTTSILVDKYICAAGTVFSGSRSSSFSGDILRIRSHEGTNFCYDGFVRMPA